MYDVYTNDMSLKLHKWVYVNMTRKQSQIINNSLRNQIDRLERNSEASTRENLTFMHANNKGAYVQSLRFC